MSRFAWKDLNALAGRLLEAAGLPRDRAEVFARVLVEADLMGHTTHGLRQLPRYLDELAAGRMAAKGDPKVLHDTGSTFAWDGGYLPGPWLVHRALEHAYDGVRQHPVVWGAVSRSHHICSLSSYLLEPASRGYMCFIATSDPATASVAPFGGRSPLYTPNPIAMAIPTGGDPILVDMSTSATANGVVQLYRSRGRNLPGPWVLDGAGRPTDDPNALFTDPPGTVLPSRRHRPRLQGLCPRPDRRGAHLRPCGPRAGRRRQAMGRLVLRRPDRSRGLCGQGLLCAPALLARRRLPREPRPTRRGSGMAAGRDGADAPRRGDEAGRRARRGDRRRTGRPRRSRGRRHGAAAPRGCSSASTPRSTVPRTVARRRRRRPPAPGACPPRRCGRGPRRRCAWRCGSSRGGGRR